MVTKRCLLSVFLFQTIFQRCRCQDGLDFGRGVFVKDSRSVLFRVVCSIGVFF